MRVRHPYALDEDAPSPDGVVHWGGRRRWSEVSDDGTFEVPDDAEHMLDQWADGYGYELSELLVTDGADGAESDSGGDAADGSGSDENADEAATCDATVQSTGEPCGRELPCPYHSED